jgi:transitional endoplasmic reticulum ATPase
VMDQFVVNVLTPIVRADECREYGVPLKRGILMEGPYGTGKTLAAYVAAAAAVASGATFIYLERADELEEAIRLAHQYGRVVIFSEDIDRVVTGERSIEMDDILNVIDGIDSKNTEVMVVLTTNHVENINRAMLRPGRLDAVISVRPPDAAAAAKLVKLYGRGLIDEKADLTEVGEMLKGNIPAVIREVVERSKMSRISRIHRGEKFVVDEADLLRAAASMKTQLKLLEERPVDTRTGLEKVATILGAHLEGAVRTMERQGVSLDELVNASRQLLDMQDEARRLNQRDEVPA